MKSPTPITEQEWKTTSDVYEMLDQFPAPWDGRKLWLFGCACLRRVWHLLEDPRSRECVDAAEAHADGNPEERDAAVTVMDRWFSVRGTLTDTLDSQTVLEELTCTVD